MYILHGRRHKSHVLLTLTVVAVVVGAGVFLGKHLMRTETVIGPAPAAVVTPFKEKKAPTKVVDLPLYSFKLPADWEEFKGGETYAGTRSWRNTVGNKGVQSLTVYVDSPVQQNLAVNRVLPVEVKDSSKLDVAGTVSDNCTSFTTPTKEQSNQGKAPAKWQKVDFVCDIGNYLRQVAGIAVAGSVNSAMLTGDVNGRHSVFMTFTDNNPTPDYDTLSVVVGSFELK
jgi:hypothetical protein